MRNRSKLIKTYFPCFFQYAFQCVFVLIPPPPPAFSFDRSTVLPAKNVLLSKCVVKSIHSIFFFCFKRGKPVCRTHHVRVRGTNDDWGRFETRVSRFSRFAPTCVWEGGQGPKKKYLHPILDPAFEALWTLYSSPVVPSGCRVTVFTLTLSPQCWTRRPSSWIDARSRTPAGTGRSVRSATRRTRRDRRAGIPARCTCRPPRDRMPHLSHTHTHTRMVLTSSGEINKGDGAAHAAVPSRYFSSVPLIFY